MVLIECTSGAGGLKLAGIGSSGSAASVFAGPVPTPLLAADSRVACPSLWDGIHLMGKSVSSMMGRVEHFTSSLSLADLNPFNAILAVPSANVAAGAGFAGTLGFLGAFGTMRYWINFDDDDEEQAPTGLNATVRPCISIFSLSDAFTVAAIVSSFNAALDVPLRAFAAGGLMLSFPMTWLTDSITRYYRGKGTRLPGQGRGGFFAELLACAAAFAWLGWGTVLLSTTQTASSAAPLLFWMSFVQCVLTWSVITVGIVTMILSTVISLLCGTPK
eukprot:TRINITY_DN74576_c0_g1_i1.p1 TRINITY_DN74576_c0_g1~~TRINITY_DN74576_c0_g1_i1.p1  ORF type:complete len:284 (-),score=41.14 TRINITY_DN74576_c0_g1_i1:216-1037(-)